MAIRVSFNGRQPRNPIVRAVSVLLTLLIVILVFVIGAAVLLPLLGIALALGLIGAIVLMIRSTFRRDAGNAPPPPAPMPPNADPEIVEDDRVARAKPVERV